MNKISYRKSGESDLEQIKALTIKAYGQFRNILSEENAKAWEEHLGDDATYMDLFKTGTCFVAICNENVIGPAFMIPHGNPYKWFDAEWSYIRLVGVLPEFEGQGAGRQLTRICIDYAKQSGEKTIALHTSEFQHTARLLYQTMGFVKRKDLDLIYGKQYYYTLLN